MSIQHIEINPQHILEQKPPLELIKTGHTKYLEDKKLIHSFQPPTLDTQEEIEEEEQAYLEWKREVEGKKDLYKIEGKKGERQFELNNGRPQFIHEKLKQKKQKMEKELKFREKNDYENNDDQNQIEIQNKNIETMKQYLKYQQKLDNISHELNKEHVYQQHQGLSLDIKGHCDQAMDQYLQGDIGIYQWLDKVNFPNLYGKKSNNIDSILKKRHTMKKSASEVDEPLEEPNIYKVGHNRYLSQFNYDEITLKKKQTPLSTKNKQKQLQQRLPQKQKQNGGRQNGLQPNSKEKKQRDFIENQKLSQNQNQRQSYSPQRVQQQRYLYLVSDKQLEKDDLSLDEDDELKMMRDEHQNQHFYSKSHGLHIIKRNFPLKKQQEIIDKKQKEQKQQNQGQHYKSELAQLQKIQQQENQLKHCSVDNEEGQQQQQKRLNNVNNNMKSLGINNFQNIKNYQPGCLSSRNQQKSQTNNLFYSTPKRQNNNNNQKKLQKSFSTLKKNQIKPEQLVLFDRDTAKFSDPKSFQDLDNSSQKHNNNTRLVQSYQGTPLKNRKIMAKNMQPQSEKKRVSIAQNQKRDSKSLQNLDSFNYNHSNSTKSAQKLEKQYSSNNDIQEQRSSVFRTPQRSNSRKSTVNKFLLEQDQKRKEAEIEKMKHIYNCSMPQRVIVEGEESQFYQA